MRQPIVIAIAALAAGGPARAQVPAAPAASQVQLEVLRPTLDGVSGVSSWIITPGFLAPLGRATSLIVEVPVTVGSVSGSGTQARIGNPYIGARLRNGGTTIDLGLRAPLGSEPTDPAAAISIGLALLADWLRFEAYLPKVVTARIGVARRAPIRGGAGILEGRLAGAFMASTEGGDPEVVLDYDVTSGVAGEMVEFTADLSGRLLVTEEGDFGERTVHYVGLRLKLGGQRWRVRPSFLVRLPLDEVNDVVKLVFGVGLEVPIR